MKHTKKDLEKSIAQMKKVLDADSTSASTKELIRPNLEKAEKLLAELEDTGKKTVPPAKEKFADDAIKKAMQVGRKEKPLNKKQKETLKGIVAASKKLTKHYTGYTETDLKRDAARSADKPGRRVSASGKTYSEYRANRSDISSKAPHLAKGGLISKDEKVTLMLATNYLSNYKKTLPASSAGYNEIDTIISKFKTDPADYGNLNMAVLYLQLSEKEITRDANAQATLKGIISQLKTMANKHGAKNSFAAGGVVLSKDKNGQISSVNRREDGAILSVGQETLSGKILSFVKDKSYQGGIGVELDNKGRFVSINVISLADEIDEGNFIIEVDGDPITLDEFIDVNENLEDEYLDKVKLLQPGETTELFFGAGGTSIVSRPATMAAGGTTDDPMWHHVGLNRPPNNFTPAATKAFKDAIELLEKETDKDGAYYKNAKASLTSLVYMVNDMLAKDGTKATEIHYLLQKVGIYNYKTGLLVDTSFLDKELAARKLEHGGRLLSAINRDRAYKSQQPHEQAYKRKTSPKNPGYKYAGGGPIPEFIPAKKIAGIQYFTPGPDDGNKPLFNQEEVDLIKDGYRIAYEYRAARMTKAEAEKHLKNYKKENKDSKLVFSDNEFGGNWRIWAKKNMAKGGKVKPGKHSRADLGKIYKEVVGYDISEDDKEATAQDIIDLMKGYDKDHYKSYKTKPFADKGVYKAGGKIRNLSRDRQFKSQEPHEQKYVRKTTPRNPKYKIDKAAIKAAKSIGKRRK